MFENADDRKSSWSNPSGNCIRVGTAWRRSSRCGTPDSDCVEVGQGNRVIVVRDTTQDGAGPVLPVEPRQWRAFLDRTRQAA